MIGQLKPQPTEVMARNIRPAGAMRARAPGWFGAVMGWNTGWELAAPCRLSAALAIAPGHASPAIPGS